MLDAVDFNPALVIVNAIEDAILACANTPSRPRLARQLDHATWSWIVRKPAKHHVKARHDVAWQLPKLPFSSTFQQDGV